LIDCGRRAPAGIVDAVGFGKVKNLLLRWDISSVTYFPAAPWSGLLKAVSAFTTLLLLAVTYAAWRAAPPGLTGLAYVIGIAVPCIPLAVVLVALLFVVVGYEVDATELRVRRLLWATTLRLNGVNHVWQDPEVIRGSLRVVGNGGLFSFSGVFWSKRLGRYRIFATDLKRCVVLVLTDRVLVVTPADPEAFIQHIRALFPTAQGRDR
jgi:hypothetical protein